VLVAAVVLALAAGSSASGATATTPKILQVNGRPTKGRMSIRARESRPAHARNVHLRQTPNMLGRMPVPTRAKGTASSARPAGTTPGPMLLASTPGSVNILGMDSTTAPGWDPPDTNGDVGPFEYVQIVNMSWQVFDKAGNSIGGPYDLNSLWAKQPSTDPCNGAPKGDPTIVYDPIEDRWLMSYFAYGLDGFGNPASLFYECLAVSLTGDPLGYWWLYDMDMTPLTQVVDGGFTPGFPDYPKLAVWPDGFYMSANLFWPEPDYNQRYAMGVAFEKHAMMDGQYARWRGFVVLDQSQTIGGMLPANYQGTAANAPTEGTPNPYVAPSATTADIYIYQFDGNWAGDNFTFTTRSVPVSSYYPAVCADSLGRCIPQPGTSLLLPAVDSDQYMYRSAYRRVGGHESLVFNQTVDAASGGHIAGIHWYELRGVTGSAPTEFTEGTFSPNSTHRWMGAASIDQAGNIGVGYNVSDATSVYPGIRYAGRTAGASAGTFDVPEVALVNGGGHRTGDNGGSGVRWGDYSSMSVDPVDGCTFWFTGEYLPGNVVDAWSTRIGTFRIPSGTCQTANQLPTASFTLSSNPATAGTLLTLNGSASTDPDAGDTIQSYAWDFDGDGSTDQTTGSSSTTHTFSLAGTYFVGLRVVDNHGGTGCTTRTLTVNPANGSAPPGDPRNSPVTLTAKTILSNVNASLEGGETHSCSQFTAPSSYGRTVWLSYHAASPGTLTLRSSGFDTVMALYKGDDATALACNDDDAQQAPGPSVISRRVEAGDYKIQVGGLDNGGGGLTGVLTTTANFVGNVAPTAAFTNSKAIAHHAVSFDGSGSSDSDGTIAKYEWDLDGNGSFETNTGTTATTSKTYDAAGTVNVKLRVTDSDGATTDIAHDVTVANPAPPTAKMTFSPNPALAGGNVTFDGSGSADADHTITKYEWDLDGDGTYERDTGGNAKTTNSYGSPGSYTIGLRVTDSDGLQGTTTGTLNVNSPPDNNTLFGVTINDEATYTRAPKVKLSLRFPAGVTAIIVSNDGGFLHPTNFAPQKSIDWELVSTGPERLPKTVYVRFATGPFVGQNYTDDIILDEKPPVVEQAAVAGTASVSSVAVRAAKVKKWKVKVKATDSNSGVGGVEITANKKKPGKWIPYKKKLTVKSAKKPKYVRARDKAGNVSGWKKAR
jgi:PKD repeat protein